MNGEIKRISSIGMEKFWKNNSKFLKFKFNWKWLLNHFLLNTSKQTAKLRASHWNVRANNWVQSSNKIRMKTHKISEKNWKSMGQFPMGYEMLKIYAYSTCQSSIRNWVHKFFVLSIALIKTAFRCLVSLLWPAIFGVFFLSTILAILWAQSEF